MADMAYDKLADRLTDPATRLPSPIDVATGEEATSRGRAFLLREYGNEEAIAVALRQKRR